METNYTAAKKCPPKIFIDANTLISGLFFEGPESILLNLGIIGSIELVTCTLVLVETKAVAKRKFHLSEDRLDKLLSFLTILETEDGKEAKKLIRDQKDPPILATALRCRPDCLITGDEDFHTPRIKRILKVLRTREFLKEHP